MTILGEARSDLSNSLRDLIEHFVAHFVENGPISIECDDEVRDEVFNFEPFGTS